MNRRPLSPWASILPLSYPATLFHAILLFIAIDMGFNIYDNVLKHPQTSYLAANFNKDTFFLVLMPQNVDFKLTT